MHISGGCTEFRELVYLKSSKSLGSKDIFSIFLFTFISWSQNTFLQATCSLEDYQHFGELKQRTTSLYRCYHVYWRRNNADDRASQWAHSDTTSIQRRFDVTLLRINVSYYIEVNTTSCACWGCLWGRHGNCVRSLLFFMYWFTRASLLKITFQFFTACAFHVFYWNTKL